MAIAKSLCFFASCLLIGVLACNDNSPARFLSKCLDPIPLPEAPNPPELGYIVGLLDGVDMEQEMLRLEDSCGFHATTVFIFVSAFHAVLSPAALDCLRCDPVVENIVPNRPIFPAGLSTEAVKVWSLPA